MLGFSYASVPLYQLYCQATGFGGTVQTGSLHPALSGQPPTQYTGIQIQNPQTDASDTEAKDPQL